MLKTNYDLGYSRLKVCVCGQRKVSESPPSDLNMNRSQIICTFHGGNISNEKSDSLWQDVIIENFRLIASCPMQENQNPSCSEQGNRILVDAYHRY